MQLEFGICIWTDTRKLFKTDKQAIINRISTKRILSRILNVYINIFVLNLQYKPLGVRMESISYRTYPRRAKFFFSKNFRHPANHLSPMSNKKFNLQIFFHISIWSLTFTCKNYIVSGTLSLKTGKKKVKWWMVLIHFNDNIIIIFLKFVWLRIFIPVWSRGIMVIAESTIWHCRWIRTFNWENFYHPSKKSSFLCDKDMSNITVLEFILSNRSHPEICLQLCS